MTTTYYEQLADGTIGCFTTSPKVAEKHGLTLATEEEIIIAWNGGHYFRGQEPAAPETPYHELRAKAYPAPAEFLDAQVKLGSGDAELAREGQLQLEKYIRDCLDVKALYPKTA